MKIRDTPGLYMQIGSQRVDLSTEVEDITKLQREKGLGGDHGPEVLPASIFIFLIVNDRGEYCPRINKCLIYLQISRKAFNALEYGLKHLTLVSASHHSELFSSFSSTSTSLTISPSACALRLLRAIAQLTALCTNAQLRHTLSESPCRSRKFSIASVACCIHSVHAVLVSKSFRKKCPINANDWIWSRSGRLKSSTSADIGMMNRLYHQYINPARQRKMDKIGLDTVAFIEDNYIHERGLDGTVTVDWLRKNYIQQGKLGHKSDSGGLYSSSKQAAPSEREGGLYLLDVGLGCNNPELSRIPTAGKVLHFNPGTKKTSTIVSSQSLPDGIDVSHSASRIFWTNMGKSTSTHDGSVHSANLDGLDVRTLLSPGTVHTPK